MWTQWWRYAPSSALQARGGFVSYMKLGNVPSPFDKLRAGSSGLLCDENRRSLHYASLRSG